MQTKYRLLWDAAYDEGVMWFTELDRDPTFRDFVILFITEGYKESSQVLSSVPRRPEPRSVEGFLGGPTWRECG
jgi:hypothetical protein